MRLLNTSTLILHEFFGSAIPDYAILSHRWETEEVTFQDLQAGKAPDMKGFSKIKGCCAQAALDGGQYIWVDSCCIDKTSSAELSEAINSMFQWYQNAQVCYVFLSDVAAGQSWREHEMEGSQFRRSKWWTRGWTLQELLAPKHVVFFDQDWKEVGTKACLEKLISTITGINWSHLRYYEDASVAQKMSWASRRETTRVEDQAYSLMGLFNVHMPTLYGEGWNAFQRLQYEILASSDDESLFAWCIEDVAATPAGLGLLADHPSMFAESGDIIRKLADRNRPPISKTNKGVRIECVRLPANGNNQFLTPLNCGRKGVAGFVALLLFTPHQGIGEETRFHRSGSLKTVESFERPRKRDILFIGKPNPATTAADHRGMTLQSGVTLATESLLQHGFEVIQVMLDEDAEDGPQTIQVPTNGVDAGKLRLVLEMPNHLMWLKFTNSTQREQNDSADEKDSFIILLERVAGFWTDRATLRIFITSEKQPLEREVVQFLPKVGTEPKRLDRISEMLPSGSSVSAAIRWNTQWKVGGPMFTLDVTINPEGFLPWPSVMTNAGQLEWMEGPSSLAATPLPLSKRHSIKNSF